MANVDMSDVESALTMCATGMTVAFIMLGIERFVNYRMNKE